MGTDHVTPFRTEILAASKVPTDPVRCPTCNGQDLVLRGQIAYPARISYSNGVEVDKNIDYDVEKNFELSSLVCIQCQITFEIQSDAESILYMQNRALRQRHVELTGQDPYGENPC